MKRVVILLLLSMPAAAWAAVCEPGWTVGAEAPLEVMQAHAAYSDGRVYMTSGVTASGYLRNMLIYNVAHDSWSFGDAYDTLGWTGACLVAWQGKVYAFGGYRSEDDTYLANTMIYDIDTNTWSAGAIMPFDASDAACAAADGIAYIAGGYSGNYETRAAVYDIADDSWDSLPPLPRGRALALGAANEAVFFVAGGIGNAGLDASLLGFAIGGDEWTELESLQAARAASAGGLAADDRLYVFAGGGDGGEQWAPIDSSESYHLDIDSWFPFLPSVPVPLVASASAFAPDDGGRFVLAGGGAFSGVDVTSYDLTQLYSFCWPQPSSIAPDSGPNDEFVDVVILGAGFQAGDTVLMHQISGDAGFELQYVAVEDGDTITGTVPAGVAHGHYDVEVVSITGESGLLYDAYEAVDAGDDFDDEDDDTYLDDDTAEADDHDDVAACAGLCGGCVDCAASCAGDDDDDDVSDDDIADDDTSSDDDTDDDQDDDVDKDDDDVDISKEGGDDDSGCGC